MVNQAENKADCLLKFESQKHHSVLLTRFFLFSQFHQGMAAAARSQGQHKQRIWVNISLSGIKIIDEKTGVRIHFH